MMASSTARFRTILRVLPMPPEFSICGFVFIGYYLLLVRKCLARLRLFQLMVSFPFYVNGEHLTFVLIYKFNGHIF